MTPLTKFIRTPLFRILFFSILVPLSCTRRDNFTSVTIADQYGIAYAPVEIMKHFRFLEKENPDIKISWIKLGNTAAIREAMVAGKVQAGFMAVPPFLIGLDKGMTWKIVSGVAVSPTGLVAARSGIESIKDIKPSDRIALPQPGSIQHILLSMAAEKEFGNPRQFDPILVTLSHPDGLNALAAGNEITLHFTSMPYLAMETEESGFRQILSGRQAFGGDFSFIVAVADGAFIEKGGKQAESFTRSLKKAIDYINENPQETAEILSAAYGITPQKTAEYLSFPGTKYTTEVLGVEQFTDFMERTGYITSGRITRREQWAAY